MVYVLNENGHPLMPTENYGKVRILLKHKKAKVIRRCPFTIQLMYSTKDYTQNITLGVDAGSKHIGLSATTKSKELYAAEVELRRKINQAPYLVKYFRLFDKVKYQGKEYFIFGRRQNGYFDIRTLNGEKVNNGSLNCKKIKLLEKRKNYIIERREAVPPITKVVGFHS